MAIGYISHINSKGHYGFIHSPELQLDHIFFHSANRKKSYKHIFKGDKVSFEIDPLGEKGNEVKDISFIKNASLEGLRKDFENSTLLKGVLKKIDEKYYVKDRETDLLIRLMVTSYVINIKKVYEEKLDQLIDYKIIGLTDKNKIRAIIDYEINLRDEQAKFIHSLKPGDNFLGKVESVTNFGVFISIGLCDGLLHISNIVENSSFLSEMAKKEFSKALKKTFLKGQEIDVIVGENLSNRISFTWEQTEKNKNLYEDIYAKFNLLRLTG